MNRIARYIALAAVIAVTVPSLTGCRDNYFAPKKFFYGVIKNNTQWLLYVPNPANMQDVHELGPRVYFSAELEGSREYIFRATLPDGQVYAEFRARINSLSGDARINDVNVDWAWVIGGPFMAAVTPVNPGTEAAVSVEITNFRSDKGVEAPTVRVFQGAAEMSRALKAYDQPSPPREEE